MWTVFSWHFWWFTGIKSPLDWSSDIESAPRTTNVARASLVFSPDDKRDAGVSGASPFSKMNLKPFFVRMCQWDSVLNTAFFLKRLCIQCVVLSGEHGDFETMAWFTFFFFRFYSSVRILSNVFDCTRLVWKTWKGPLKFGVSSIGSDSFHLSWLFLGFQTETLVCA